LLLVLMMMLLIDCKFIIADLRIWIEQVLRTVMVVGGFAELESLIHGL
jgi:hypothetical protein